VFALMLQKNPALDAEQVRLIFKKTAKSDGTIGAVPNPLWGWGMINPATAITALPLVLASDPESRGMRHCFMGI